MPLVALLTGVFSSVADLFKAHIESPEKQTIALAQLQEAQDKAIKAATEVELAKIDLEKVQSQSSNWLVSGWRPGISLLLAIMILLESFGLIHPNPHFWDLATYFLGGFAVSRSAEHAMSIYKTGKRMS